MSTHPYGNAGRNIGRSNAFFNLDSGYTSSSALWNGISKLEFRGEFFNTLNKTNFSPAERRPVELLIRARSPARFRRGRRSSRSTSVLKRGQPALSAR